LIQDCNNSKILLIWDAEGDFPNTFGTVVLWNNFKSSSNENIISAPLLVESNSNELRNKILAWIHQLGETRIRGTRIVDILEIEPNLSYWWFTSLGQKFNISAESRINDAVKALAIEQYLNLENINGVHLVSSDIPLIKLFKYYCKTRKLKFSCISQNNSRSIQSRLFHYLPDIFKALLYHFWFTCNNFKFLISKAPNRQNFQEGILFMDVFVHLNKKAFETGDFISNYWTSLPKLIERLGIKTNWLHNFYRHESVPNIQVANDLIGKFNDSSSQNHSLIEAYLSPWVLLDSLKIYSKLFFRSSKLSKSSSIFIPPQSSFNFSHLLMPEFKDSLRGKVAISNCIRISLTKAVLKSIPYQKKGFYIQENQPWELAATFYWKKFRHGVMYGIPHSTVRYWDLRYFYDARTHTDKGENQLPKPNYIALNGSAAYQAYIKAGYPEVQLRKAEALRYLHLLEVGTSLNHGPEIFTILVCGDFLKSTNDLMISCLVDALTKFDQPVMVIIKPHPANPVRHEDYPKINFEISYEALSELFLRSTLVFTSNITSAAVDAYYSLKPLVQFLDGAFFNVSPLREVLGINYITESEGLLNCLLTLPKVSADEVSYFFLNRELDNWKILLSENT
jgi:surface carbohydrate biosynthesis protein (TIGR04326 family)